MINLRKISLLLVILSLAVFAGCSGDSSLSSTGNNTNNSSDTNYTISFNGSGAESGNIEEIQAKNNQQIQLPANTFIKNGYKFTGWSESENGTVKYTNEAYITVKSDLKLYAVWEKEDSVATSYNITLYSGYDDTYQQYTNQNNESFQLPDTPFSRSGYIFLGWSLEKNGEVNYKNNNTISINNDIVLYAVWQEDSVVIEKYTVTFNGNGAESGSISPVETGKGQSIILPANKFAKNGYIFAGWSDSSSGNVIYADKAEVLVNKDMVLYAVWQYDKNSGVEFTVNFDTNGGTGSWFECRNYYETRIYGGQIFLPFTTCQKDDLVFLGWAKQADAKDALYKDGQIITVTENMDLYAVWANKDDVYVVNFDKNNGSGFGPSYLAAKKGNSIVLPAVDNWKRLNYVPIGYSTTSDANGEVYKENTAYTPENNTTLYVTWHDGSDKEYAGKTRWAYGVNGADTQWEGEGQRRRGLWTPEVNWYDTFQEQTDMCWAASSSNAILWWYHNNKAYIEKYEALGHQMPEFKYTTKTGANSIFEIFKKYMLNDGNQPPVAFNYFITGSSLYEGGAYFKDVFNGAALAETVSFADKANFNAKMKEAFDNNMMVSMETTTGGAHIITIWGIEYNSEGFIDKLYLTDSATAQLTPSYNDYPDKYGDLVEAAITYNGSDAYIEYDTYKPYKISKIYLYSLGQDIWEAYFNKK